MITQSFVRQHRGMALIAVLWLVAAMSLIISGVVQSVRLEMRTVGMQRHTLVTKAQADAVVLLALNKMQAMTQETRRTTQSIPVQFQDLVATVQVRPLTSLIDLNNAPLAMLTDLYRYVLGLDQAVATTLAQATLKTRDAKNSKNTARGFYAVEELMNVPGMIYDHYDKIKSLVTVDIRSGNGRIYPVSAPFGVLLVLTAGDVPRATALAAQRKDNPNLIDTSFFKPESIDMASSDSMQFQVHVEMPDGRLLQNTWIIQWGEDPSSGLPWQVLGKRYVITHSADTLR